MTTESTSSAWDVVRDAVINGGDTVALTRAELLELLEFAPERLVVDPDYPERPGFDENFLGIAIPMPTLSTRISEEVALPVGSDDPELRYHHFSILMSASRCFAFLTASNVDGRRRFDVSRHGDRWVYDPRVPAAQIGNKLYEGNSLDRGHLVRRQDPVWGDSFEEALKANNDTFHFTNCTPQHSQFNQNPETWHGLEDFILSKVTGDKLRANVYTGPVFRDDDPVYRHVALPRAYWKIVAAVTEDGALHSSAYLLSQKELLVEIGVVVAEEETLAGPFGPYKTFQTTVVDIEVLTDVDFGSLRDADVGARPEHIETAGIPLLHELHTLQDVVL